MSNEDIKTRIEEILSDILSDKYEAKITIKFFKDEESSDGDCNKSGDFREQ